MNINNWIVKNRVIRRLLVFAITYFFLTITIKIFYGKIVLDAFLTAVYGIFTGLETLIVKFYLQGKKDEAEGD